MSNLFILGNGFDLAHCIESGYSDFKEHLSNKIKDYYNVDGVSEYFKFQEIPQLPELKIQTKNDVLADYDLEEQLLYWLIDDVAGVAEDKESMKWREFESYLGMIHMEKPLKRWGITEENAMKIQQAVRDIGGIFFRWINTINLSDKKPISDFKNLIGNDDLFLTFNYTETLENLYKIPQHNICYIHGKRVQNKEERDLKDMTHIGSKDSELIIGCDENLFSLSEFMSMYDNEKIVKIMLSAATSLFKNTDYNILHNQPFFNELKNTDIQNIYSMGFSYSDVDMPYIQMICDLIKNSKNITWKFNDYDDENKRESFKEKVFQSGFGGNFETFHLQNDSSC